MNLKEKLLSNLSKDFNNSRKNLNGLRLLENNLSILFKSENL